MFASNVFLFWFAHTLHPFTLPTLWRFCGVHIHAACYVCWFIVITINPVAKLDIHNHQIKHVYGDFTTGSGDFWYKITEFEMQCKCLLLSFAIECCCRRHRRRRRRYQLATMRSDGGSGRRRKHSAYRSLFAAHKNLNAWVCVFWVQVFLLPPLIPSHSFRVEWSGNVID